MEKKKEEQSANTKKPKRKPKRERWPSLNAKRQVYNRKEYLDYDYLNALTDEQKDLLNKFSSEYYMASFKKDPEQRLNKDTKKSYDANNARNRCMLSNAVSKGLLDNAPTQQYLDNAVDENLAPYSIETENDIINRIALASQYEDEYTVEETKMYLDGFIHRFSSNKLHLFK